MRTKHRRTQLLVLGVATLTVLGTVGRPALGSAQAVSAPTFARDVAPILQRSCQQCHRPGGIGPMSLLTFEQVRPWAKAIKLKTGLREMPPWFIEKNIGIRHY